MTGLALTLLTPIIVGPLTFVAMQGLKSTNAMVDALPPTAKRFVVALIAAALTAIGAALGVNIECDAEAATSCLATLDKESVKAIVAAIVAYAVHALKNIKK